MTIAYPEVRTALKDVEMIQVSVCPVCSGTGFNEKSLISSISVATCKCCGFIVSAFTQAAAGKNQAAMVNMEAYEASIGAVRKVQAAQIVQLARRHVVDHRVWLDAGCGFGYLLSEAVTAGFEVTGVEPDDFAYQHACKLVGDDKLIQGLMQDDTRPDNSLDVLSMLDVLEHIPANAISDYAKMVWRKLTADGLWIVKVPSTDGLYYRFADLLVSMGGEAASAPIRRLWLSEHEFPHTVYFSGQTLSRFMANHGFECVEMRYLSEIPNSTVLNRLQADRTIPYWQALMGVPVFYLINLIEGLRKKSDALLMIARKIS